MVGIALQRQRSLDLRLAPSDPFFGRRTLIVQFMDCKHIVVFGAERPLRRVWSRQTGDSAKLLTYKTRVSADDRCSKSSMRLRMIFRVKWSMF